MQCLLVRGIRCLEFEIAGIKIVAKCKISLIRRDYKKAYSYKAFGCRIRDLRKFSVIVGQGEGL